MKHALKIAAALSLAYTPCAKAASNAAPWGLDSTPSPHVLTLYSDGAWNVFANVLGSGGNQNITWPGQQTFSKYPIFTALTATNGLDLTATTFSGCAFKSPNGFCVTQAGVPQSPAFPSLTTNVEATGTPGLDMNGCTSVSTCGWFLWSVPNAYPAASIPGLRVTKVFPSAGGGTAANVYSTLWASGYTGESDQGYIWNLRGELHNRTAAATGAQNVATAGSVIKEIGANAPGTQIGPSWGMYADCTDLTTKNNPTASCIGAEFDSFAAVGSGTDTNFQRVGLQVGGGVYAGVDAGVHIGTLILAGVSGSATVDRVFYLGAGSYGRGIDLAKATFTSPAINLAPSQMLAFDADGNGAYARRMYYSGGLLAYNVSGSVVQTTSDGGNFAIAGSFKPGVVTIATLPACDATSFGIEIHVSNGTAYGVGTYGSPVGAAGAVLRNVICTNTGGVGVYAWAYN